MIQKTDCIFCKIINGEIPSFKIWGDKDHIAILDNFPNTEGMTLVMTKKHFDSYVFEMPDEEYSKLLMAAKKVGKLLDKKLNVARTAMVAEGMGVNHIHIKLYPLHDIKGKDMKEFIVKKTAYYEKYPGYLTTLLGPKADPLKQEKLAKSIRE